MGISHEIMEKVKCSWLGAYEMITYPRVTKINDKYIMFYCGNAFGKQGFGYAELE